MKEQFIVTTISQTEIPALLDSWDKSTYYVKMLYSLTVYIYIYSFPSFLKGT